MWFTRSPMGKSTLRNVVQDLCSKSNIEGFHTNHSLRATTCSLALGKGVPEKLITDRTGHRDVKSLHVYQRERGAVSDVLQGSKNTYLEGSPPEMLKPRAKKGSLISTVVQLP